MKMAKKPFHNAHGGYASFNFPAWGYASRQRLGTSDSGHFVRRIMQDKGGIVVAQSYLCPACAVSSQDLGIVKSLKIAKKTKAHTHISLSLTHTYPHAHTHSLTHSRTHNCYLSFKHPSSSSFSIWTNLSA